MTRTSPRRRLAAWAGVAVGATAAAVVLALFQPWKLVVDDRVDEASPVVASAPTDRAARSPVLLAQASLISHEHRTSGGVQVLALADGSRVLRLENLDTSNGPNLKVWITDAPVLPGRAGWGLFDDGRWVDLGALEGNLGSSNYPLPPEVDLTVLSSVSIWCDRFNVSFGAAQLDLVGD